MKLTVSKSKNATSLYACKSIYVDGKHTSKVVEKLGTYEEIQERLNGGDPIAWAKEYIAELTRKEKEENKEIRLSFSPAKQIAKDEQRTYNGGYLFLQQIYHQLGLHKICKEISAKYKFDYDLNSILSRLLYGRIIHPASKYSTYELSSTLLEAPAFQSHDMYRALDVLSKETDFIQSSVYNNSKSICKRKTGVLYYDCTNYFFEIEQEDDLRKYGVSKEHRPTPIVQMGLFMDSDGIPLAFDIHRGNTNEQTTLRPLEEKIIQDFEVSQIVICTDAGLSSTTNRKFNNIQDRAFITTQSIKKLKSHLKSWALDPKGWKCTQNDQTYNLDTLDEEKDKTKLYYKERWIKEDDLEQKLIVTFSLKHRDYQRAIRDGQIERARDVISSHPSKLDKRNPNDFKRFIRTITCTKDGEVSTQSLYTLKEDVIAKEARFDGFYGLCTNLEDPAIEIVKVNQKRWEIEECFRIMKSEFKARPVYLSREDRIKAHFTTCFLSLILYRFLEKKLDNKYTCQEIIQGLRNMNFFAVKGDGYIPAYTRTNFTDDLHQAFGFRTDYQIIPQKNMKKIFSQTKS